MVVFVREFIFVPESYFVRSSVACDEFLYGVSTPATAPRIENILVGSASISDFVSPLHFQQDPPVH